MVRSDSYPAPSTRLDVASAVLGFAFMSGLIIDGWSHAHYVTETFFTPAHALFYAAFALIAATTVGAAVRNHARGYPWTRCLPRGYNLSLVALLLFFPGIPIDLAWHIIVGPEKSLAILLSPTHLYLATFMGLILTGPLRAAFYERPQPRLANQVPMLLSAAAFLMLLEFFTQYAFAFDAGFSKAMAPAGYQLVDRSGNLAQMVNTYYREIDGLFAVFVHAVLIAGIVVFLARTFRLARGGFTVLFVLAIASISAMTANDVTTYVVNVLDALLTGVLADVLYATMRPSASVRAFRAFATLVLAAHYALFFTLEILLAGGTWWSPNLVLGSIFIPAIVGFLMSVLASTPERAAWNA